MVCEVCALEVEPDGLGFRPATVKSERIREDADYEGVRIRFDGVLARARIAMQLGIGIGDVMVPGPVEIAYPTLLDLPAPRLANRGTALKAEPVALTTEFSESEVANSQWRALVRKGRLANAPASLSQVVSDIAGFLGPVARAHMAGGNFRMEWTAGGPWRE